MGVTLSPMPVNWREIVHNVNEEVNALPFEPMRELNVMDSYSGGDHDCKGYAIEKLHRLYARGIPIERMRLATCFTEADGGRAKGNGHMILVVDGPQIQLGLSNGKPVTEITQLLFDLAAVRNTIQDGATRKWGDWTEGGAV